MSTPEGFILGGIVLVAITVLFVVNLRENRHRKGE